MKPISPRAFGLEQSESFYDKAKGKTRSQGFLSAARLPVALVLIIMAAMCLTVSTGAQIRPPSGQEILRRVDENITAGNKVMTARMIIHLRRASRTVEFKSYVQGTEKAFTEYLAPPRERGTKMLKLGNQLWMYSPWTERTILISGHMLRQSVMGSDLSYEDMMEDPKLLNSYTAEVVGEETIKLGEGLKAEKTGEKETRQMPVPGLKKQKAGPRPGKPGSKAVSLEKGARSGAGCWSFKPDRKTWPTRGAGCGWTGSGSLPCGKSLYARGGTLLKKVEVLSLRKFGSRWVPDRAIFKDMLKAGKARNL